jgi:hypothetical protein
MAFGTQSVVAGSGVHHFYHFFSVPGVLGKDGKGGSWRRGGGWTSRLGGWRGVRVNNSQHEGRGKGSRYFC